MNIVIILIAAIVIYILYELFFNQEKTTIVQSSPEKLKDEPLILDTESQHSTQEHIDLTEFLVKKNMPPLATSANTI